jgi:hypothetical protein
MMNKGKDPINSNVPSSAEKSKNTKKRKRDDAFGNNLTGMDKGLDEILQSLRTRVLHGEIFTQFKKEI